MKPASEPAKSESPPEGRAAPGRPWSCLQPSSGVPSSGCPSMAMAEGTLVSHESCLASSCFFLFHY